jgi:acyl carrier protein
MAWRCRHVATFVIAICGCASEPDPVEKAVRAVISDYLKVDPTAIEMNNPLSNPPLKADALDLVQIVMTLEERLGVDISDAELERQTAIKLGQGFARITPAQLVSVARTAPKLERSKKK